MTAHPRHNDRITLIIILYVNFQLSTVLSLHMVFFWVFTPCSVLGLFQWFGGMYYLHLLGDWISFGCTLKWLAGRKFMKVWGQNKPSTLHGLQPWKITVICIIILVCSLLLLVSKTQYLFTTFRHMNVNVPLITNSSIKFLPHLLTLTHMFKINMCVYTHATH